MLTIAPVQDTVRSEPRPAETPVHRSTRVLLWLFTALTLLAAHQLLVFPGQTDRAFAWRIHDEQTAAFLGAAYAAGFVLSVLALRQRSWQRVRVGVATVTVFSLLTLVATVTHLSRFHLVEGTPLARVASWFWLAVYVAVPLAGIVVVLRQAESAPPADGEPRRSMPRWLRVLLAAQGIVLSGVGITMFAEGITARPGTGHLATFWPWPMAPLCASVVGAWLIAFGIAAALVLRERDLTRLPVPAAAYTAFGVFQLAVLAAYAGQVDAADPSLWLYVVVLATVVVAGGYGWYRAARPARR